jgi:hypothetical protein
MPNPEDKREIKESITEKREVHARKNAARLTDNPPKESSRIGQCRK